MRIIDHPRVNLLLTLLLAGAGFWAQQNSQRLAWGIWTLAGVIVLVTAGRWLWLRRRPPEPVPPVVSSGPTIFHLQDQAQINARTLDVKTWAGDKAGSVNFDIKIDTREPPPPDNPQTDPPAPNRPRNSAGITIIDSTGGKVSGNQIRRHKRGIVGERNKDVDITDNDIDRGRGSPSP